MKRGQMTKFLIDFEKQEWIDVQYLGKGAFCTAYRIPGGDVILKCKDSCPEKEVIKLWGMDSPYTPKIEEVYDAESPTEDYTVWRMPYYEPLTARNKEAWRIFRELKRAREDAVGKVRGNLHATGRSANAYSNYFWLTYSNEINNTLIDLANVPEDVKEALQNMSDCAASYGSDMCMEFQAKNLGVDSEGHIIFRDIIFSTKKVMEIRREYLEKQRAKQQRIFGYY